MKRRDSAIGLSLAAATRSLLAQERAKLVRAAS
jgi:hypothetical protein